MGINILSSCSCSSGRSRNMLAKNSECLACTVTVNQTSPQPGLPDPSNYKVIKHKQIGNMLIVMIKYYGCKNYEGTKILVFKDIEMLDLYKQELIDPHFCEDDNHHSPIARFIPTEEGWEMAKRFCLEEYKIGTKRD